VVAGRSVAKTSSAACTGIRIQLHTPPKPEREIRAEAIAAKGDAGRWPNELVALTEIETVARHPITHDPALSI